jgi:hypothetical protein
LNFKFEIYLGFCDHLLNLRHLCSYSLNFVFMNFIFSLVIPQKTMYFSLSTMV